MPIVAVIDGHSFDSDSLLSLLHATNRYIAERRQAQSPVVSGTIHTEGVLTYVLKDEHWVKPIQVKGRKP